MSPTLRAAVALGLTCFLVLACAGPEKRAEDEFYTSGSREADQRAEQRISRMQQLRGEGEGTGGASADKTTLYERLGGDEGVRRIVDDFVDRAVADPRVNWPRKGVRRGGLLGVGGRSAEWSPTPENVSRVKDHLRQFIAVATGGPARYEGRTMKELHGGMRITNAEFDATIGDMKASLDALRVPTEEQKELLAVLESTRPQIAEER